MTNRIDRKLKINDLSSIRRQYESNDNNGRVKNTTREAERQRRRTRDPTRPVAVLAVSFVFSPSSGADRHKKSGA